jgi:hypothetical protein
LLYRHLLLVSVNYLVFLPFTLIVFRIALLPLFGSSVAVLSGLPASGLILLVARATSLIFLLLIRALNLTVDWTFHPPGIAPATNRRFFKRLLVASLTFPRYRSVRVIEQA